MVNWTDDCDDCPTTGGYEYVVCLRIRNTCTDTEIYYSCSEVSSSTPKIVIFNVDNVCTQDEQVCYLLTANVVKRCVIGEATICWNYDATTASCNDIYDGGIALDVGLE